MSAKLSKQLIKLAKEVVLITLAAASFIVLISDVADSLVLWEVCLIKLVAFVVLVFAFLQTPWCQANIRDLGADCR